MSSRADPAGVLTPDDHRRRAEAILAEETTLDFPEFGFDRALALGLHAVQHAPAPVAVRIVLADIVLFAAAMDGTSLNNQIWLNMKQATVRQYGRSTLWLHHDLRARGRELATQPSTHGRLVDHGGGVPLRVGGVAVGFVGVSGLPHVEDHAVAIAALAALHGRPPARPA